MSLRRAVGSFVVQHSGTMSQRGGQQLSITIVTDSGVRADCRRVRRFEVAICDL
jgi:Protein of unknown function (DUF3224)